MVKVSFFPELPLVDRVLQCLVLVVSSQGCLSEGKGLVKILGWVWQQYPSKFCYGLSGMRTFEWLGIVTRRTMLRDTFLVFILATRVYCHIARLVI